MRNNSAHLQPNLEPFCDLETAIDCVCKALIVDEKIVLKLPDEVSDWILFWAMEQIEIAATLPNNFNEVVTAICAYAASVSEILNQLIIGIDIDRIVGKIHRLSPTIRVEDLPEGIKELIDYLLASFNDAATRITIIC